MGNVCGGRYLHVPPEVYYPDEQQPDSVGWMAKAVKMDKRGSDPTLSHSSSMMAIITLFGLQ